MQVAMARRRIAAVLVALSIVALGWSSIGAQDPEVRRLFGFLGDITIDGEPVGPGSTIAALVDDEVVAETVVNAAGAWILDVETAVFGGGDCNLTFVVNDLRAETAWETCTMRVRLALTSPEGATTTVSESDAPASTAADQSDDSATEPAADAEPDAAEDELEEEIADQEDDGGPAQSEELVRPRTPLTGSGGILEEVGSTNWARTAAVTAALTLIAALAALLISRRTDGRT